MDKRCLPVHTYIVLDRCGERDFLDNVVKKVVMAKEVNHKGQGLWVSLKKIYGDIKQVSRSNLLVIFIDSQSIL